MNQTGQDFGYDAGMWGKQIFGEAAQGAGWPAVTTDGTPKSMLDFFHTGIGTEPGAGDAKTLRMRWGGIRKPRAYSHVQLSKDNGWMLPDIDSVGAGINNWNYSSAEFQEWYTNNHLHFLDDGVVFWWNA